MSNHKLRRGSRSISINIHIIISIAIAIAIVIAVQIINCVRGATAATGRSPRRSGSRRPGPGPASGLGAKDCTPEIKTSETSLMDFQWHFPVEFHFYDFWCVIFCPDRRGRDERGHSQGCRNSHTIRKFMAKCTVLVATCMASVAQTYGIRDKHNNSY